MRFLLIVFVVLVMTSLVFLQSKPDSLVQKVAAQDFEKVQGFAERNGLNCSSHTPTLFQFLVGGRPKLLPHFICRAKAASLPLSEASLQAQELKSNFGHEIERYFTNSEVVIGIRYGVSASNLVCYFPLREWKWVWCLGDADKGCFLADCTKGLR